MAMTRLGARSEALLKRLKGQDTMLFKTEELTNLEVIQLSDAVWKVAKYVILTAEAPSGNPPSDDDLFTCPDCGEEVTHFVEGMCELCWTADEMESHHYA